jgi:hypothetical protein
MREILWKGDKVGIIVSTTYRLVRSLECAVYFRKDELYNRMALTKIFYKSQILWFLFVNFIF